MTLKQMFQSFPFMSQFLRYRVLSLLPRCRRKRQRKHLDVPPQVARFSRCFASPLFCWTLLCYGRTVWAWGASQPGPLLTWSTQEWGSFNLGCIMPPTESSQRQPKDLCAFAALLRAECCKSFSKRSHLNQHETKNTGWSRPWTQNQSTACTVFACKCQLVCCLILLVFCQQLCSVRPTVCAHTLTSILLLWRQQ